MPEVWEALATPGLLWLILTISIAGVVRGFTGFGTALIFVPVAGRFLPAADVVVLITLTGVFSTIALIPRAWGGAERRDVGTLGLAAALTVPLGLWLMSALPGQGVRWAVALVAGGTLLALLSGWRFKGVVTWPGLLAIGALAGVLGGMTGLTGPAVILFYLASPKGPEVVRANTILFLAFLDAVIFANLWGAGVVTAPLVSLAVILGLPYFVATLLGQRMFDPAQEQVYRRAAFGVIGLAVLTGLPVW